MKMEQRPSGWNVAERETNVVELRQIVKLIFFELRSFRWIPAKVAPMEGLKDAVCYMKECEWNGDIDLGFQALTSIKYSPDSSDLQMI